MSSDALVVRRLTMRNQPLPMAVPGSIRWSVWTGHVWVICLLSGICPFVDFFCGKSAFLFLSGLHQFSFNATPGQTLPWQPDSSPWQLFLTVWCYCTSAIALCKWWYCQWAKKKSEDQKEMTKSEKIQPRRDSIDIFPQSFVSRCLLTVH